MARDVTVKLSNGETLIYKGVPRDVTPDEIAAKAKADGGADVVEIDGGDRSEGEPVSGTPTPVAPAAEKPSGPDAAGFQKELGAYYQGLKGKPLDTSVISSLAEKYQVGTPLNLEDIEAFYTKSGRLNPQLLMTGPKAPAPAAENPNMIVATVPKAGDMTQRVRAFGKGLLFDFADELEAAGRMVASGELSADEYYKIKGQINADYQNWAKANPGEALGLEIGGGIAGAFIPGLNAIGTGMRGARAAEAAGSVALQGVRSGAITGGLSGLGQAETMSPGDVIPSLAMGVGTGGLFGGTFAKGAEFGGRGFASAREAILRRMGRETGTPVDRRVAEVLYGSTQSPEQAIGQTIRSGKYDVPTPLGLSNPELAALTEKVLAKPSAGREALATQIAETQADASKRIQEQVQEALPGTKDYFDVEDAITANLRKIGDTEYKKAFDVGLVNDRELINLANNPELSGIWAKAQRLARLEGRELPIKMEAVVNEAGDTVGLRATDQTIPDVQSLHYLKRALDDTIDAGFRGNAGVGKAEASALKESIRNPLVARLDKVVPEYGEARKLYAGDMEVRDALRLGRDIMSGKMRSQQLAREVNGIPGKKNPMSEAEREALRTGARQSIFQPLEDAATNRNFAQRLRGIRGDSDTMAKLKLVMKPQEFRFFDRALKLEDELFKRGSKVLGGSRTVPLSQGLQTLDDMISGGNISQAVDFVLAPTPGRIATLARWVANLNPGKEFGDKVYTRLSQVLSAKNPNELVDVLKLLADSKAYGAYMAGVKKAAVGPVAGIAGNVAPTITENKSTINPPRVTVGEEGAQAAGEDVVEAAKRAIDLNPEDNAGLVTTLPTEAAEEGNAPFSDGRASVAERNNNPGNLIVSAWTKTLPGYIGPGEGTNEQGIPFARFDNMQAGKDAKIRLIVNKVNKGYQTPRALVRSWLSPTNARGNPKVFNNYVDYVASRVGIGPNDNISQNDIQRVAQAIYEFESGDRP
jgi:hypothetical protein